MMKLFSKNSNLCDHNSPTLQTDRQTTCDRNTALCTKVHRAVIKNFKDMLSLANVQSIKHNVYSDTCVSYTALCQYFTWQARQTFSITGITTYSSANSLKVWVRSMIFQKQGLSFAYFRRVVTKLKRSNNCVADTDWVVFSIMSALTFVLWLYPSPQRARKLLRKSFLEKVCRLNFISLRIYNCPRSF